MLIIAIPIAIGISLIGPSAISIISKNISSEKQGQLMGLNESLSAFMRILGLLVGTGLFAIDINFPWLVGIITLFLLLFAFLSFISLFNRKIKVENSVRTLIS
jgi:MFS family permease